MDFTFRFLTAAGEYLQAQNVGKWTPPYSATDFVVSVDAFGTSDRAIMLNTYPVQDDSTTDSILGLQLWIRGAPKDRQGAKSVADRAFDSLHDLQRVEWGGIPIVRVWRQQQASHGPDANGREEISADYYVQHTRAGAHRRD